MDEEDAKPLATASSIQTEVLHNEGDISTSDQIPRHDAKQNVEEYNETDALGFFRSGTKNDAKEKDAGDASSRTYVSFKNPDEDLYTTNASANVNNTGIFYKRDFKNQRGVALVFWSEAFKDSERKMLLSCLRQLEFFVVLVENPTLIEVKKYLNSVAKMDHSDKYCLLVITVAESLSGHLVAENSTYNENQLWLPFTGDRCQGLIGKPKIFAVITKQMVEEGPEKPDGLRQAFYLPSTADILIISHDVEEVSENAVEPLCDVFCRSLSGTSNDILSDLTNSSLRTISLLTKKISFCDGRNSIPDQVVSLPKYSLTGKKVALIFNHEKFSSQLQVSDRRGTAKDKSTLKEQLEKLGFEVSCYDNLKLDDIKQKFARLRCTEDNISLILVTVMSHGSQDRLYAYNDTYKLRLLFRQVSKTLWPEMDGKPKIFIIQACQGSSYDDRVTIDGPKSQPKNPTPVDDDDYKLSFNIPDQPDLLIGSSTVPGYFSWRNTCEGSWYIQSLCKHLKTDLPQTDMQSLLTQVSYDVASECESTTSKDESNNKRQMPSVMCTLKRKLYITR